MRRTALLILGVFLLSFGPAMGAWAETRLTATPVQANPSGSVAGHVVAIGIGAVAGVLVANAALPAAWGLAASALGAVGGGMAGNWTYVEAIESPMLRRTAATHAETPSLFHLATLSAVE